MKRQQRSTVRSKAQATVPLKQRGFVFDIDGTLALADPKGRQYHALPGARKVIGRLNAANVPTMAFTNGTLHTPQEYRETLNSIGIEFAAGNVMTPASIAAQHFLAHDIRRVMVLGAKGTIDPLEQAGIDVVLPSGSIDGVQAVLVGWFPDFGLPDLDAACRAVWAGAALFAVSVAPFFASRNGRMLGISGAIVAMVKSVTGRRATVLGKPSTLGIRLASTRMGRRISDLVVVGDDPELEMTMARRAGAFAVGVSTGIAGREVFLGIPKTKAPHLVIESLEELLTSDLLS
jgi:4-nitrophenyl phosphatase